MHVAEFQGHIGPALTAPVYLFCSGKAPRSRVATFEPFLAEQAAEQYINTLVAPENKDFSFSVFYGDETDAAAIAAEAETYPFLAERRVILVRNADRYASESAGGALHAYLSNPSDFTTLLCIAPKIDRRSKLFKACQKAGQVVECPALNEQEMLRWVHDEAARRKQSFDGEAARELVRRSGARLSDLDNALTVVIDFLGDEGKLVGVEDVTAACADVAEEEVWALTDAVAASRPGEAFRALSRLTDLGKHPDELIGTLNWLLKCAYRVDRGDETLSRFVAGKVRPLAEKLGGDKLPAAFALCTDTQFMMRNTGVDGGLALELLVAKLAAPRRKAAP